MRLFCWVIFLFLFSESVLAQQIDSLSYLLSLPVSGEKISLNIDFAQKVAERNPTQTYLLAKSIVQKDQNNNLQLNASAFYIIGYSGMLIGEYAESTKNLYKAIELWEKLENKEEIIRTNCYLARVYARNYDTAQAFSYAKKALDLAVSIKNLKLQGLAYHQFVIGYFYIKDFSKSLPFSNKALQMRSKADDKQGIMSSYNMLGLASARLERYDSALFFYRKAKTINEKYLQNLDMLSAIFDNLSDVFLILQQYDSSFFYLEKGLKIAEKIAIRPRIMESYESLANYYEKTNNTTSALDFYRKYIKLKDSIFNEHKNELIYRMNASYNFEKKEAENEILRQEKTLNRYILLAVGSALFLMFLLVIILFFAFKQHKKNHFILQKQQKEILEKNKILEMQKGEIMTQNVELNNQKQEIIAQKDYIVLSNEELNHQYSQIQKSVEAAKLIQEAILPFEGRVKQFLPNYFVLYKPKDVVSGDFFWIEQLDSKLFVAVIDCTGHGIAGAFMCMIANTLLDQIIKVRKTFSPDQVLNELNTDIRSALRQKAEDNDNGMDAAFVCVEKAAQNFNLSFAGSKHPLFYFCSQTKEVKIIKGNKFSIGEKRSLNKLFNKETVILPYESIFYLFSDGYVDQCNPERMVFGSPKLFQLVSEIANLPIKTQKIIVENTLNDFQKDTAQRDDILLVGIKIESNII